MSSTRHSLEAAGAALEHAAALSESIATQSDDELIACAVLAEALSRWLDVVKVCHAGEIARRSSADRRDSGLAARRGFVNAASLVRDLTKTSFREAAKRIRVGRAVAEGAEALTGERDEGSDGPTADPEHDTTSGSDADGIAQAPFLAITQAVTAGELAADSADRVIGCLEPVVDVVDPGLLIRAAEALAIHARTINADELASLAREMRDGLDRVGITGRERDLRARRCLRKGPVVDGMRRVLIMLDPESDALLVGALDSAMSPRLGGPRFTDPRERERGELLAQDDRTNEQLALDVLVELVRLGSDRDTGALLGATKPGLRVTIAYQDLINGLEDLRSGSSPVADVGTAHRGAAWLEGHPEPLSPATARRLLCENGALPIVLGGDGLPIDVGRAKRLFTGAQRVALAVRDGGCRWPSCDRPPSWSEAHHIAPFAQGGSTDLADGILLCRRHHLILHNNGWNISRERGAYWLSPPTRSHPEAKPIEMRSKRHPSSPAATVPNRSSA